MKPTVFLSHSSQDQAALGEFKKALEQKTGRSVQLFLSSDGQSIPLGRNWIHRIEQALDDAALMLVFLSPAAVASPWIFFEAGYAYSRKLRVVPIAFAGFDISRLAPPLSLMQGFGLSSSDGMNNVIALINQQFDLSFIEDFSEQDYLAVFGGAGASTLTGAMVHVNEILVKLPGDTDELLRAALAALSTAKIDVAIDAEYLRIFGATFAARRNRLPHDVEVRIHPAMFEFARPAVDAMLRLRQKTGDLVFLFERNVRHVREFFKVSALLYGTGVEIASGGRFTSGHTSFKITDSRAFGSDEASVSAIGFVLGHDSVGSAPFEIAELLWRRRVLHAE